MRPPHFKSRICVYCGARAGDNPRYRTATAEFAGLLAAQGRQLVYGGGRVGLMGELADQAKAAACHVTGVIPESLVNRELAHPDLDELVVVRTMHERKAEMERRSDAFVALPGGWGTLDEVTEMLTWSQLRLIDKPVGLLNVAGFFDPLVSLVDRMEQEGFMTAKTASLLISADDPIELLARLDQWQPEPPNSSKALPPLR